VMVKYKVEFWWGTYSPIGTPHEIIEVEASAGTSDREVCLLALDKITHAYPKTYCCDVVRENDQPTYEELLEAMKKVAYPHTESEADDAMWTARELLERYGINHR